VNRTPPRSGHPLSLHSVERSVAAARCPWFVRESLCRRTTRADAFPPLLLSLTIVPAKDLIVLTVIVRALLYERWPRTHRAVASQLQSAITVFAVR
jgi:hypothetical protein